MKKKRALAASRIPDDYSIEPQGSILTIHDPSRQPNTITFNAGGDAVNEMIRISPEGFWVRGERDWKSTRLNSSHEWISRMPSSA